MVSVPDIIGNTIEGAKEILAEKKLFLKKSGIRLHERLEEGKIIFQNPLPGSRIRMNKVVHVLLSAGKEKVIVPRMIGRSLQSLNPLLEEAGLRKGKISHIHTLKYSAGKIIAHNPLADEEVPRETPVSFLVSQGEKEKKFLMPDLLGLKSDRIVKRLKEMDFRVGEIRQAYYPGLEAGIIIKQLPPQGYKIKKRSLITLEVSK